jgi:hypothetical protein
MMQAEIMDQIERLNSDLERLIVITHEEIEMVKNARHAEVGACQHEKEALLKRFEMEKERLNQRLMTLTQNNPGLPLEQLLDNESFDAFERFRERLSKLHDANQRYGTIVAALGEFFNSLVSAILPMQEEGYRKEIPKPAAFLQVRA